MSNLNASPSFETEVKNRLFSIENRLKNAEREALTFAQKHWGWLVLGAFAAGLIFAAVVNI